MSNRNRTPQDATPISRRSLLKTVLYTSPILLVDGKGLFAGPGIEPLYQPRIIPPGQQIRVAQVGVFNRGGGVLKSFQQHQGKQLNFRAFADVDFRSHDYRMKDFPEVPCYRDYREMLEAMHDQIDAVIVATPDHAHFPVVMHAMLLGKHVYVEKPLANNVYECRLLDKTARACGVVTQMGNQGHSGAGTIEFGKWVEAGRVKNVKRIDAWMANSRRWHGWTYKAYPEEMPPVGYDWDQWLCRRPFRPYSKQLVGGNWRCWYEFGCGAMGDWGAHILDGVHRYLKLGQPYEIATEVKGPSDLIYPQGSVITFRFKARDGMPPLDLKWYDGQGNVPAAPKGYAGKMGGVGSLIYTQDYVIQGRSHGAAYKILPAATMESLYDELPKVDRKLANHYQNFLNACQGIEPANSSFDVSAPLSEVLCLGCIGQRFGGTLRYDGEAMKITNHAEANAMLRGPQVREGWDGYDRHQPVKSKVSRIRKSKAVAWEPLVKDARLSNWENPYDYGKAELVDGEVHLTSEKGKWFLLTKKSYANFVFEGEVQIPANQGNSGFLFRCLTKKNRAWGYQAEVDPSDRKWSGGLYDEGRRMWFISPNRDHAASEADGIASIEAFRQRAGDSFKQGQWNRYRIVCIGSHIQIYVNDTLTTDIHDEMDIAGPIGIQHHGEKGLLYRFRNLRIKDLGAGGEVYYPHREEAAKKAEAQAAVTVASTLQGDVYEAEAAIMQGVTQATNHAGYQGDGFADFGEKGTSLEWDNILADAAGSYQLTFRYASGGNRPCELVVNGRKVGQVAFKDTQGWTSWKTEDVKVTFRQGGNSVKLVAIGNGPNLDAVAVNKG